MTYGKADLAEMGNYAKENRNNRYILVVIDCFSKFMKPIKNKSGPKVTRQGYVLKNLNKYNVNHYSTYTVKKVAIVERVIRTLKEIYTSTLV
ncbi:hypothetical protein NQ317_019599 [Molorchus minor]|uniref:Integrase catalytic domain-containing protein n=1 Tax=Molorchus minor TaxID=1323400 RepID=A0ABQ9J6A6_9CUCU|nr:hypothetical protein NQ317_019599 [Molorchus minor]